MNKQPSHEDFFEKLARVTEESQALPLPAPSRLKARIYSALVRRQARSGPLLSLSTTKAGGRGLCVFEHLVQTLPIPERLKCKNLCAVCHARVLAERLERAPIYWRNCPYVKFQKS